MLVSTGTRVYPGIIGASLETASSFDRLSFYKVRVFFDGPGHPCTEVNAAIYGVNYKDVIPEGSFIPVYAQDGGYFSVISVATAD